MILAYQRAFSGKRGLGVGPTGNGNKFTLNIQPVMPMCLTKDWNVIVRTIVPIVSQHDLFYSRTSRKIRRCNRRIVRRTVLATLLEFLLIACELGSTRTYLGSRPRVSSSRLEHIRCLARHIVSRTHFCGVKARKPVDHRRVVHQLWSVVIGRTPQQLQRDVCPTFINYTTKTHTTFTIDTETTGGLECFAVNGKSDRARHF